MRTPPKKILMAILGLLFVLYPLIVYWGMQRFEPRYIGVAVLFAYLIRSFLLSKNVWAKKLMAVAFVVVAVAVWLLNSALFLLLMPVIMNAIMMLVFAHSYLEPPTIPARFAARIEGELNSRQISYTNKVTLIWIGFFIVNGVVASYTVFFSSKEIWMLYNGFISYILVGSLFALEFLYRHFIFYGDKR